MAGAQINLKSGHELLATMKRVLDLTAEDWRAMHSIIGNDLVNSTKQRFIDEAGPTGDKWKELAPITLRNRKRKHKDGTPSINRETILRARDNLFDSIHFQSTVDSTAVGSNRIYAAIHQYGGQVVVNGRTITIPARPYLGLSDADKANIQDIINEYMEARFRGE